jgi:hypothetical protein
VKGFDEAELASFVGEYLKRGPYPHLLGARFFQGTIQTVAASGAAFLCTLARTNESAADGNTYFCCTPGYAPAVADLVECVWLDANVAIILWPVNRGTGAAGTLGFAETTTTTGGITAQVDLPGLTKTVTVGAGRRVRITGFINVNSSVGGDTAAFQIQENASILQTAYKTLVSANNSDEAHVTKVLQPSPGAHTYKLTLGRAGGTGNITDYLGGFLLIEDIGV